ncbi:MAG: hypothetical protein GWM90_20275 [Gemmatimonadetes bacterium]|nr:hypothetical protein [Gemmatimonadota bacterium]NIQ56800.1 hypothetical protein [Gemmatimonadota bacterium]NIU76982.1 hypothetical protein [Gammaproteobacteria bacterium]NIX46335.1 hypothetical protein [Gemmatimonadota bacterium]NIY10659.1 hypothetical protein [Gemmatimonadota bacterium]
MSHRTTRRIPGGPALAAGLAALLALATIVAPAPAAGQTNLLELDAGSDSIARVRDDGGVLLLGTFGTGIVPMEGVGTRFLWYPGKSALRAGTVEPGQPDRWDEANIGPYSMGLGRGVQASGLASVALGWFNVATGDGAVALGAATTASGQTAMSLGGGTIASGLRTLATGTDTEASGNEAVSIGWRTLASGHRSFAGGVDAVAGGEQAFAFGNGAQATGHGSVAFGPGSTASGFRSRALGHDVQATADYATGIGHTILADQPGSLVLADASRVGTGGYFGTSAPNEMNALFVGGFTFYAGVAPLTGCTLPAGSGAWSCTSSRDAKTDFRAERGDALLRTLRQLPITTWSYLTEPGTRHMGPVAEEFHAAFGLGGDERTIAASDLAGVSLRAVQALLERVETLESALETERGRSEELAARLKALEARLDRQER